MTEEETLNNGIKNMAISQIINRGQQMLTEDQLNCSHCHELLCIPIILVDGGHGNMCQKCFEAVNEKSEVKLKGIENTFMNALLKTLELPCKYQPSGCQLLTTFDEKLDHEKVCLYQQSHGCLLLNNESSCDWKGCPLDFIDHFLEKHEMHIVEVQSNNKFNFDLPPAECNSFPLVKLLRNPNICLFFIACIREDKMFYKVFDGKNNDQPPYEYVKISHNVGSTIKLYLKCTVGTLRDYIRSSVQESEMNLLFLSQFRENAVALQIQNFSNICILSKNISQHFECPVCKKTMLSAIHMCRAGHSFCGECKRKLTSCPTCQGDIENARNFALEHVSGDVVHPCHYECGESFLGSKLQDHMKHCVRKTFKCPLDTFVGGYDTFKDHFKAMHARDTIFSNSFSWQMYPLYSDSWDCYMFYRNSLFESKLRLKDQKLTWVVRVINSFVNKYNFIYEISFISTEKKSHKLTISAYYSWNERPDEDCVITLDYKTIMKYSDHKGFIKMTCKIKAVDIN